MVRKERPPVLSAKAKVLEVRILKALRPQGRATGRKFRRAEARPSGTEDIYKIYAESFRDEAHLDAIVDEARQMVDRALSN